MAQKPIAMEQLKQILQLQKDGVGIREMARRTGISLNSVRKYLALLSKDASVSEELTSKALADKAYGNDSVAHDAERLIVRMILEGLILIMMVRNQIRSLIAPQP